jgi:predicted DNA-binding transcriptional regulator YafY
MDQPKIERMLRLMRYMSGQFNYTVEELADKLDMSERTIYRYIDTFKGAGFAVTKLWSNVYKLEKMPKGAPDFDKLMIFSEEESYLINSLLDALVPTNALKKGIKDKLAVVVDSTDIASYVDRRSNAAHVTNLTQAAREKKKVLLKGYESGHSHTIRDRLVEPYGFTTDYIDVCAYDLEDGHNKIFKIQRINEVEILNDPWEAEKSHHRQRMDIFHMSGHNIGHIRWQMSVMAKNLLIEEFPLAEKALKRKAGSWILDTDVCSYAGACRFYVGLAEEIRILDSPEFEVYVKAYVRKNLMRFPDSPYGSDRYLCEGLEE